MKWARRVLVVLVVGVLLFAGITWAALELPEVAVLRTTGPDGAPVTTRVWVAEEGGHLWLEAPNRERPWLRHVESDPVVELTRRGETRRYGTSVLAGPAATRHIRRLFRDKYGIADWWVGVLADTSASFAVRLEALEPEGAERAR